MTFHDRSRRSTGDAESEPDAARRQIAPAHDREDVVRPIAEPVPEGGAEQGAGAAPRTQAEPGVVVILMAAGLATIAWCSFLVWSAAALLAMMW